MISEPVKRFLTKNSNSPKELLYNYSGEVRERIPCITNPNKLTDCKVKILLLIQEGIVLEARAEIFGEPIATAAGNWLIPQIKGQTIEKLNKYIQLDLLLPLMKNDLSSSGQGLDVVFSAFSLAISNYYNDIEK